MIGDPLKDIELLDLFGEGETVTAPVRNAPIKKVNDVELLDLFGNRPSSGGVFKYTSELLQGLNTDLGIPVNVNQTNIDKYNQYDEDITRGVTEKGGNPNLVKSIMFQESRMNEQSEFNIAGMRGFPQTTQATVDSINTAKGENYTMDELITNPYRAAQWISDYVDVTSKEQNANTLEEKIILYDASPSALKKYRESGNDLSVLPDETQQYIKQVKYTLDKIGDTGEWSGISEPKPTPLLPKQEWQDDPVVEELKARDEVSGWTSATNFAKFKVQQDNAGTDVANQKIQGIDTREKEILNRVKTEKKLFEDQQKVEFETLTADYNEKTKKLKEKLDKTLPKTKTPQEYESAIKEYNDALQAENDKYKSKWDEKNVKYKEQAQKLTEGFTKEGEQLSKEIEGLNKEIEEGGKQTKIKTNIIQDKAVGDIQKILDNAPEDYKGKKDFVKKYVDDAVEDYLYGGGTDVSGLKEELYAVINEKLLFDKDGKPTVYAIKNQAEIGKMTLKKSWDEYNQKVEEQRVKVKYNPFELQDERDRLIKATENFDVVLDMPDGTEGEKPKIGGMPGKGFRVGGSGSFLGGWSSQKGWLDRAMGMGIITRGADVQFSKVAKKSQQGVPLNPTEQALLDSEALLASATDKMSPGFSTGYQVGSAISGSIEWMTSMASTSGIYSKVFKGVMKGLGYKVGAKILSKNLPKYLVAEAAGAVARVPLQAPFYVDLMTRRANITPVVGTIAGTVKGEAYVPEESFTKSAITSLWSQSVENLSEMAGKYIDFGLGKLGSKAIESLSKKFNLGALTRVAKSKAAQGFNQVTNKLGLSGPIGEFGEEKIAEVLHWVDGSTQPKDFFDRQQNWVTFLSVATMIAPFSVVKLAAKSKGEVQVSDFLNKDQVSSLNKITALKDIEAKAKQLGNFILDNNLHENFEQQQVVAKHVWDSQQEMVAEEMAQPEAEVTETGSRYSHGGFEVSKEVAQEAIKNAETVEELQQIGVKDDEDLKKQITAKANNLGLLKQEENRFNKEIEAAGVNEAQLAQVQKEHAKRKALILSGKQIDETVKEEKEKKDTEIKTEISYTQLTEKLTGEQEGATVKPEVETKLSKLGEQMKAQFDKFTKKATNALPHVIVDSIEQLPKEVKDRIGKVSEDAKVQAFVDPKTNIIYFVAQNIPKNKVLAKWVHEQGIHRGLEVLIPKKADRDSLLKKVFDSVGIDKIKESIPKVYGVKHESGKLSNEGIAEEYMAHLAEKIITEKDLTPEEKSVWQKVKEFIEKIIRKTYGKAKLTDKEIAEVIRASVKSIYSEEKIEEKPKVKQESLPDYIENNKTEIFSQLKANGTIKVKGEC